MTLSALFMVKDESSRLPAALASVAWADEVVVADTGSSDDTRAVAKKAGARVADLPWRGYTSTRNEALRLVSSDWVLFLDADERVSPALSERIRQVIASPSDTSGWRLRRVTYYRGQEVRFGVWQPEMKLRLGRLSRGFRAYGLRVHEKLLVDGPVGDMKEPLWHYPYESLSEVIRKAALYAKLSSLDRFDAGVRGRLPSLLLRPFGEFFRSYLLRLGFLDGLTGFEVSAMHSFSYFLRAAFLWELSLRTSQNSSSREKML